MFRTTAPEVESQVGSSVDVPLRIDDLPSRARLLGCAGCGRTLGAHEGLALDCPRFTRPALPSGLAYADSLRTGDQFAFFSAHHPGVLRVAASAAEAMDPRTGLLHIASDSASGAHDVHLIEPNTIVVVPSNL